MQTHYKKYPPKKRYIHVANFMEELYQMHQSREFNDALFSAIVKFLTLVRPQQLREADDDLKTVQYLFILPEKYVCDKQFLRETFRPTLEKAAWLSTRDNDSKVLYLSVWMDFLYSYQCESQSLHSEKKLQPEKIYILCDIQKMVNQNRLLVTVQTAKMVYDPDFVKAAQRSSTLLGENALLVPQILGTILHTELYFDCSLERMKKVAKLLFLKVFAKSSDSTVGDDTLDDYYHDNAYYSKSFMHDILVASMSYQNGTKVSMALA